MRVRNGMMLKNAVYVGSWLGFETQPLFQIERIDEALQMNAHQVQAQIAVY